MLCLCCIHGDVGRAPLFLKDNEETKKLISTETFLLLEFVFKGVYSSNSSRFDNEVKSQPSPAHF